MRTLLKYVGFWFLCVVVLGAPFCGFFGRPVDWLAPVIPFLAVPPAMLFTHLHNRRADRLRAAQIAQALYDFKIANALDGIGEYGEAAATRYGLPTS